MRYGYNAASNKYEDLMAAGIIDPTKVSIKSSVIANNFIKKKSKFE